MTHDQKVARICEAAKQLQMIQNQIEIIDRELNTHAIIFDGKLVSYVGMKMSDAQRFMKQKERWVIIKEALLWAYEQDMFVDNQQSDVSTGM